MALLVCAIQAATAVATPQGSAVDEDEVRAAIVQAVRSRVGDDADVRVEAVTFKAARTGEGHFVATPEPGARLGYPARFALSRVGSGTPAQKWAAGHAVATITVTVNCVRLARPVAAGALLSAEDVIDERSEVGTIPLQRPPSAADAIGARANRALQPGEVVLPSMISVRRLVRSGETVTVRFRGEGLEVEGRAVAAQSGALGDVIRVVNPSSRRSLDGRIVGPAEVEVVR